MTAKSGGTRGPWAIVIFVLGLTAVAGHYASRLEKNDDLLAFLPQEDPDVALFQSVNKEFGGTEVALVGIEEADPFNAEFIERLQQLTESLEDVSTLDRVLSLTNILDYVPDEELGGVISGPLVNEIPQTSDASKTLRAKVMARDHVVGNLISKDGKAILIYCYLAFGKNPRDVAATVETIVREHFPRHSIFWGGGPFISTYIYNSSQNDLNRLTPWAVAVIVLIMLIVFRDAVGTLIALVSTSVGIILCTGLMAALGIKLNIVLSSAPVVLFAVGSAYALHILARYYAHVQVAPGPEALARTLKETGPVVATAGMTTAVSLFSFVAMDIGPMRLFGLFTGLGIFLTMVLALTFVPALIRIVGHRKAASPASWLAEILGHVTARAKRTGWVLGLVLLGVASVSAYGVSRVDTGVDMTTFFASDSPPAEANAFLKRHFGGAEFIQIHATGDMSNPGVLRTLRYLADRVRQVDHVTSVQHIGTALAQTNQAMVGQARIPDLPAQVNLLLSFMGGERAVGQLIDDARQHALMHIKVDVDTADELADVLERIEGEAEQIPGAFTLVQGNEARKHLQRQAEERISAAVHVAGAKLANQRGVHQALKEPPTLLDTDALADKLERFLRSEECAVVLPPADLRGDPARRVAEALADLEPGATDDDITAELRLALAEHAAPTLIEDLLFSVVTVLSQQRSLQKAQQHAEKIFPHIAFPQNASNLKEHITTALLDLDSPDALQPSRTGNIPLDIQVTGLPVMHRGLSRSATRNQIVSLAVALTLVLIIMMGVFRSVRAGLLALTPTLLTIAVIYGAMGFFGIHLDIGTSMLASIILGAGVDYAVHLMWAWRCKEDEPRWVAAMRAGRDTGPAILTNTTMIAAGFWVLTFGEAKPLQNVGGLTAAAMIVAAAATFLALPALAQKRRYRDVNKSMLRGV